MIKKEPHSQAKLRDGRYRLISVLSLVDQMVDRCLFGTTVSTQVSHPMDSPGKSGWSPFPEGFVHLERMFDGPVLATDCSAFDWTFPAWLVDMIHDLRMELMKGSSESYRAACRARWHEVLGTSCVIRLPSGERLRQTVLGLMKSGWLNTISVNSDAQWFITVLAFIRAFPGQSLPRLWAMGDDVLLFWLASLDWSDEPRDPAKLVAEIAQLGILTKMATPERDFAGFRFHLNGEVVPLYSTKHKFMLAHADASQVRELCSAYGLLYALTPPHKREWLTPLVEKYGRWTWRTCRLWARGVFNRHLTSDPNAAFHEFYNFWN